MTEEPDIVKRLRKEKCNLFLKDNEELERQIDEVNAEVEQLRQQVIELRAERDALRRTLCRMFIDPNAFAAAKNWDCFEEEHGRPS